MVKRKKEIRDVGSLTVDTLVFPFFSLSTPGHTVAPLSSYVEVQCVTSGKDMEEEIVCNRW